MGMGMGMDGPGSWRLMESSGVPKLGSISIFSILVYGKLICRFETYVKREYSCGL